MGADRVTHDEAPAGAAIVVFSGDLDKLLAAFMIATSAAASGLSVCMFFTFWGLAALRQRTVYAGKSLLERLLTALLPAGPKHVSPSRLSCLGLGRRFFGRMMRRHNVAKLEELVSLARDMNVRMCVCETSMRLMGIDERELVEGLEFGGVASFLGAASRSRMTLFI